MKIVENKMKKEIKILSAVFLHWLIGGLLLPVICGLIIFLPIWLYLRDYPTMVLLSWFVSPLIIVVSVKISANYLGKKYIIRNGFQIANYATIGLLVLGPIYTRNIITLSIIILSFFFASRKYLKNLESEQL